MSKEKLISLTKYQSDLKNKADSKEIPTKHINRERQYRDFLSNELRIVTAKIETMKMVGVK